MVGGGGICGEDIVSEAMAGMDGGGGRDAKFSKDGKVNILGIKAPADGDEPAISTILYVVGGDIDARRPLLWRRGLTVSFRLFQEALQCCGASDWSRLWWVDSHGGIQISLVWLEKRGVTGERQTSVVAVVQGERRCSKR